MDTNILTDPALIPVNDVMKVLLKKKYTLYKYFVEKINDKYLILEWYYEKREEAWIARISRIKSGWKNEFTSCFLRVTDNGFLINLKFNKNEIKGIYELSICDDLKQKVKETIPYEINLNDNLKQRIQKMEPEERNRLIIYSINILFRNEESLNDLFKLLEYRYGMPSGEVKKPNQMLQKENIKMSGEWKMESNAYSGNYGILIFNDKGNKVVEIEIKILDFASQWYSSSCLQELILYLLYELGYERIIINTKIRNTRLQKLYESKGFLRIKTDNKKAYYELTSDSLRTECSSTMGRYYSDLTSKVTRVF